MNASSTQAAISVEETQSAVMAMIEEQHQQTQEAEQMIQQQTQEAAAAQAAAAALAAESVMPTQDLIMAQPPAESVPTASTQAQGRFYSQAPVDGTTLIAGQAFTVTWTWGNTGSTNWDEDFKLVFTGGTNFSAGAITEKYTNSIIYPNGHGDYSLDCVAPLTPGTYTMYWHVVDSNGETIPVTENMSISINVVAGELTPTPAPTDEVQYYIAPSETPSFTF